MKQLTDAQCTTQWRKSSSSLFFMANECHSYSTKQTKHYIYIVIYIYILYPPLLTCAVGYNVAKSAFRLAGVGNSKDCAFRCRKRMQETFLFLDVSGGGLLTF